MRIQITLARSKQLATKKSSAYSARALGTDNSARALSSVYSARALRTVMSARASGTQGSAIVSTILTTLISVPALAQVGYRSSDGYYYIRGLENNKTYQVDLGGMPLIRAATSNKCGILQFKPSKNFQPGDKFEIKDEKASITYGFIFGQGLPKKETPKCESQVVTQKEIWVTPTKFIAISGLTPSSAQTIKLLSNNQSKNLRANLCGFIAIKLDSIVPSAFITEGKAYPTNVQPDRGIACRKGMLYVSYPTTTPINPIPEDTWKQQNPLPNFSPETLLLASNGSNGSGGGTTRISHK